MADISKIKALDNITYDVKDTVARKAVLEKVDGPAGSNDGTVALFDGITGKTIKDSGFTIGCSVPANALFTDTTYSAATVLSAGLMSASDKTKLNGIAEGATANAGTITGVTMNGESKGTSGVVDLGTVITKYSILEYLDYSLFPLTGEEKTLYIDTTVNSVYRWSGTRYIQLVNSSSTIQPITSVEIDALFT